MLLNEYEIEFMFRKIRNLGNFYIRAQNGLDFRLKLTNETTLSTPKSGVKWLSFDSIMAVLSC
jgi:hypothetical protein